MGKLKSIGVCGLPSHSLKPREERLVMTYGHRRAPLGNQTRISTGQAHIWSEPINILGDGTSSDLGHPSTVELGGRNAPECVVRVNKRLTHCNAAAGQVAYDALTLKFRSEGRCWAAGRVISSGQLVPPEVC
jgi:hypothetical protein